MKVGDTVQVKGGADVWMQEHGYYADWAGRIDGRCGVIVGDYTDYNGTDAHFELDFTGCDDTVGVHPQFLSVANDQKRLKCNGTDKGCAVMSCIHEGICSHDVSCQECPDYRAGVSQYQYILELESDNKRMREALEHLIKMEEYGEFTEGPYIGDEVVRVCKQALEFASEQIDPHSKQEVG